MIVVQLGLLKVDLVKCDLFDRITSLSSARPLMWEAERSYKTVNVDRCSDHRVQNTLSNEGFIDLIVKPKNSAITVIVVVGVYLSRVMLGVVGVLSINSILRQTVKNADGSSVHLALNSLLELEKRELRIKLGNLRIRKASQESHLLGPGGPSRKPSHEILERAANAPQWLAYRGRRIGREIIGRLEVRVDRSSGLCAAITVERHGVERVDRLAKHVSPGGTCKPRCMGLYTQGLAGVNAPKPGGRNVSVSECV